MSGEGRLTGLVSVVLLYTWVVMSTTTATETEELTQEVCFELPETGACRAFIPQWFYNDTTALCEEFIYGGCPGSRNRFPNRAACLRLCNPEVCQLDPDVGPCRANIRVWYYDAGGRGCKQFSWGGCEGNENKFSTRADCETACAGSNLPCELGDDFNEVGNRAVHQNFRDSDWFVRGCDHRCDELCLEDHPWGTCMAYSVRNRWWKGCNCYLYDRFLSSHEFDPDTEGVTANRVCVEGTKTGKKQKQKGKGKGKGKGTKGKDKNKDRPSKGEMK